jgi:hypothetical protein
MLSVASFIVMLSVIMLSVIMLSVIMLSVIMLSVMATMAQWHNGTLLPFKAIIRVI